MNIKAIVLIVSITQSITSAHSQQIKMPQTSPNSLYLQGIQAMKDGNVETAIKHLTAAKQARHPHADYQLSILESNRESFIAKKREATLKKIIIDKVEFVDIELSDAIAYLSKKIVAKNPQYQPNFVIRDQNKKLNRKQINLLLENVPATVILENLLSIAQAKARFGEYSIVIQPN